MNKGNLTYIILSLAALIFYSCDTKDNVNPRNENFFIKYYAGPEPGDQFGADIIETDDGGLLLLGTSKDNDTNTESLIAIKTDVGGNVEWDFSSSSLNPGTTCVAKSVVQLQNSTGFVLGGSKGQGDNKQVFLIRLDVDGNFIDSTTLTTNWPNDYHDLSKISLMHQYLILSGETSVTSGIGDGRNGFVGVVNQNLTPPNSLSFAEATIYFGLDGDEYVTGAYEIKDTLSLPYVTSGTRIVVFGSSVNSDAQLGYDYFAIQLDRNLNIFEDIGATQWPSNGDQIPYNVGRFDDKMYIIGSSLLSNQVFLKEWSNDKWEGQNGDIGGTPNVIGTGVAATDQRVYIVGNQIYSAGVHEEAMLAEANGVNVLSPWPRYYGNSSSVYNVANLTILQDGSLVLIGTADLEPIKKIVVIKTDPNGEMSFE